jgi:hypothetical protein
MSNTKSLLSFLGTDMGFKGKVYSMIDHPQILKFIIQGKSREDLREELRKMRDKIRDTL